MGICHSSSIAPISPQQQKKRSTAETESKVESVRNYDSDAESLCSPQRNKVWQDDDDDEEEEGKSNKPQLTIVPVPAPSCDLRIEDEQTENASCSITSWNVTT